MSAWSYIEGRHTSNKVSMRKIINVVLEGEDCHFNYDGKHFKGSFEQVGKSAVKIVDEIMECFVQRDPKAELFIDSFDTQFYSQEYKAKK